MAGKESLRLRADAVGQPERLHRLLVVDDGEGAGPVGAPQALLRIVLDQQARELDETRARADDAAARASFAESRLRAVESAHAGEAGFLPRLLVDAREKRFEFTDG